ncbi:hypothetical protein AtNW77_Chr5g0116511 [Arabidopsis thaliana]
MILIHVFWFCVEHELGETGFDFNSECDTKVSHGVMVSRRGSEGLCYLVVLFVGLIWIIGSLDLDVWLLFCFMLCCFLKC